MATTSEQLKVVGDLAGAVMSQDWDKVKSNLTDDVFYKPGSNPPVHGPAAVVDFFKGVFSKTAVFSGHVPRKVWQEPDIVTIEMDAKYKMVGTNKEVTIACCDVYRMRDNKVCEWRVYADVIPLFYPDGAK